MTATQPNSSVAFQLDTDIIAQDIYAASALRFYLCDTPKDRPAPLSPDNKGALSHIIHNAASFYRCCTMWRTYHSTRLTTP